MTLMIDRLDHAALRRGHEAGEWSEDMLLDRVPAFEISNVADLAYRMDLFTRRGTQAGGIELRNEKFPNLGPPFTSYWMEWRNPPNLDPYKTIPRFGIWSIVIDETTDDEWSIACGIFVGRHRPHVVGSFVMRMSRAGELIDGGQLEIRPEAAEELFAMGRPSDWPEKTATPEELEQEAADTAGMSRLEKIAYYEAVAAKHGAEIVRIQQDVANLAGNAMRIGVLPPLLLAHSLLGCKNVDLEDHRPDPKMNRAAIKRHGQGLTRFTTLAIRPMGGTHVQERFALGNGQTALHLVRGHFKTFTPERPLLGKHAGTYWWSPNVRGKEEHGVVVKDYKVDA